MICPHCGAVLSKSEIASMMAKIPSQAKVEASRKAGLAPCKAGKKREHPFTKGKDNSPGKAEK